MNNRLTESYSITKYWYRKLCILQHGMHLSRVFTLDITRSWNLSVLHLWEPSASCSSYSNTQKNLRRDSGSTESTTGSYFSEPKLLSVPHEPAVAFFLLYHCHTMTFLQLQEIEFFLELFDLSPEFIPFTAFFFPAFCSIIFSFPFASHSRCSLEYETAVWEISNKAELLHC